MDLCVRLQMEGLVLLLPRQATTLALAEAETEEYFLSLVKCLLKIEFPSSDAQFREQVASSFRLQMHDPDRHVFASYKRDRIHFIYMGPEYLPNPDGIAHPRYSPHPIFVILRDTVVSRAREKYPLALRKIHENMQNAVGKVYDADPPFLAQCPVGGAVVRFE